VLTGRKLVTLQRDIYFLIVKIPVEVCGGLWLHGLVVVDSATKINHKMLPQLSTF